jgi:hypothetical protein
MQKIGCDESAIYGLVDPRDETVRYVGRTQDLVGRQKWHLLANRRRNAKHAAWIAELARIGVVPRMDVLEVVCAAAATTAEEKWMEKFAHTGLLVNRNKHGGAGRPPREGRASSATIRFLMSVPERLEIERLAKAAGMDMSGYIRHVVLERNPDATQIR